MRILPVAAMAADVRYNTCKAGALMETLIDVESLGLPTIVNTFGLNPDGTYRVSVNDMVMQAVNHAYAGGPKPEWYARLGL